MIDALDLAGPTAPPRRNGELVFDAPWQARAFAMTIALLEREQLTWDAFRPHLVRAIDAAPKSGYYEQLAVALDAFIDDRGLLPRDGSPSAPSV